jgi:small-conductance mechanosensitive channel
MLLLAAHAGAGELDARADALRADLATIEQGAAPGLRASLERQLLISLERRSDLGRASDDAAAALTAAPAAQPVTAPQGLLELDELRREIQQLNVSIEAGARRVEILHADRAAAAARLTQAAVHLRQLEDAVSPAPETLAIAKLEAELAESTIAELDRLAELIELQQKAARGQRDALAQRLVSVRAPIRPAAQELVEIENRLADRAQRLQQRLAAAAEERDAAHRELQLQRDRAGGAAGHLAALSERVNTRDIGIELAREALSNFTIERAAWQLAIRFWRDGDPAAIVEARARGPAVRASIERRLDFMNASSEQLLARIGAVDAQIAQAPDAEAASDWKEQRATFDERLRTVQGAMLDQRRLLDLLARMRGDFDTRIDAATLGDRIGLAWASARDAIAHGWNFELFAVDQTIDINGRQTSVPRSVTVAKIVKAPLLLLIGLFLAFRLTAFLERRARRRGVDAGSARLTRRWTLGLLACACALASLALAGIPLAAFAFIGGAVAIGVGFGMQTLLKNLISGLLVLMERPFRLGDEIQVGDLRGTVVDIDLRASVVRDGDGSETLIPNSVLVDHNVRKVTSARSKTIRQSLSVCVDAQSDPREVIDTMRGVAQRHGLTHAREPHVFLDDCDGDGLTFTLQYWAELQPGGERKRVASDLRLMLLGAFHAAGIRLAQSPLRFAPAFAEAAPTQAAPARHMHSPAAASTSPAAA